METDVRQFVVVGFACLEGVELVAQSELNDTVRNQVQRAPNPLLKKSERRLHDDPACLARLNRNALVNVAREGVVLQRLCHTPCNGLEEIQEISKNCDVVDVLSHLASNIEPHVFEHGHGVCRWRQNRCGMFVSDGELQP